MRTSKVIVMPYDKEWQTDFEKIKFELENAIGDMVIAIEHVGSTSVQGMSAKPCIDIDVVKRLFCFRYSCQQTGRYRIYTRGGSGHKRQRGF